MILDHLEQKRRLLRRLKDIESGTVSIGPNTVHLHITDVCNVACQFCEQHMPGTTYHPSIKRDMSFETFEGLVQDCTDLRVDEIALSGLGEPTKHPRFYDMLQYLEHLFTVRIFSNATFPIERCRDILRADRIVINLAVSDRDGYRTMYGKDLFVKVVKNIKELVRLRPQYNPDFFIEVAIIVTPLNEASQLRTERFVRKLGVDGVVRTISDGNDRPRSDPLPDEKIEKEIKGQWLPCYHGWFYCSIGLSGDVNVCCFLERVIVGNIFKSSLKQVWASEAYARARASAVKGDTFRHFHECMTCTSANKNRLYGEQLEEYRRIQKAELYAHGAAKI